MIWSGDGDRARLGLFVADSTSAMYFVSYIDIEFGYRKYDQEEGERREISRLTLLVSRDTLHNVYTFAIEERQVALTKQGSTIPSSPVLGKFPS